MNKLQYLFFFWLILAVATFVRLFHISQLPPAPYWEEVALGYDAYSIAQTGKDHHGHSWPIVAFESFGDWKPSGYFYALVPFVQTLGLTTTAVRLPSALAGIGIVLVVGSLAQTLYGVLANQSQQRQVSPKLVKLLALGVTAVSPWAIQFSRAGWEVNLATFFLCLGTIFGLKLVIKLDEVKETQFVSNMFQLIYLLPTLIFLIAGTYTYHAARIIGPFLGFAIMTLWFGAQIKSGVRQVIRQRWSMILVLGIITGLLMAPLIGSLTQNTVNQRFAETSIFSDLSVIKKSNQLQAEAGNTWLAKLLYHRYVLFGREIVLHFLDHFDLDFLFISGDTNLRHSTGWTGQLYHIEVIFLLLGFFWVFKHWNKYSAFLFFWLFIGILPAALTKTTPHALRILPTMPLFLMFITWGIVELFTMLLSLKSKKISQVFIVVLVFLYVGEFANFWRYYSQIYPQVAANEWQAGYKSMIEEVSQLQQKHPEYSVYISREVGRPAMYYWFYTQTDPQEVQQLNDSMPKDQGEFLQFNNIYFMNTPTQFPAIVATYHAGSQSWEVGVRHD